MTLGLATTPAGASHRSGRVAARFSVAGLGTALPEQVVTNEDLARHLDTSDEWITTRTGIRQRHVSGAGESTGPLAVTAARAALRDAGVDPRQVGAVVVATATPERPIPSTSSWVTTALGVEAGGFDLNAACAGFVYGLATSGGLLDTGVADTVLLVGVDTMSRVVDQSDRSAAVLFGDGAGAAVLRRAPAPTGEAPAPLSPDAGGGPDGAAPPPGGLLACDLVTDPEGAELLVVPGGGSAEPASADTVAAGRHLLQMDGSEVFRRAVRGVSESIARTLARAGREPGDVDLFVPHQANARIIDAVLARVGLRERDTVQTVERHGNTSAASIPLALSEATATERLGNGSLVLMSGFGAGMTIGTALVRWSSG